MADCTKFREAQNRREKNAHPKCRRRGAAPRIPKAVGPKTQYAILRQVVTLIPPGIIHEIDKDVRHRYKGFSVWSHIVALIYQQLTRTASLNGVCDAAKVHESEWGLLRDATVPHRNTLSNANRKRDPALHILTARPIRSRTCTWMRLTEQRTGQLRNMSSMVRRRAFW